MPSRGGRGGGNRKRSKSTKPKAVNKVTTSLQHGKSRTYVDVLDLYKNFDAAQVIIQQFKEWFEDKTVMKKLSEEVTFPAKFISSLHLLFVGAPAINEYSDLLTYFDKSLDCYGKEEKLPCFYSFGIDVLKAWNSFPMEVIIDAMINGSEGSLPTQEDVVNS
ncbi:MAG: hypothetical protein GY816_11200, partial [Cytophagales bacterium]|nr:hypothetical protein [Cytophagales bacterium]